MKKLLKQTGLRLVVFSLIPFTLISCAPGGYKNISPEEANKMIGEKGNGLLILDVRTPGEYNNDGHIKGSRLIPINVLETKLKEIVSFKDKDILVYCKVGGRSSKASSILINKGFKNIYNMSGGIDEWKRLGLKVQ